MGPCSSRINLATAERMPNRKRQQPANGRLFESWGARNRTRNNSTRNCCVASYTTPHHVPVRAPQCTDPASSANTSRTPIASTGERQQTIEADDAADRKPSCLFHLLAERIRTAHRAGARRRHVRGETEILGHQPYPQ